MKLSLIILSSFLSVAAFADAFTITCTAKDETIKIHMDSSKPQEPHILEFYNQGGLGPNFLEASYLAIKNDLRIEEENLILKSEFSMGIKVNILNDGGILTGSFGTIPLTDCSF